MFTQEIRRQVMSAPTAALPDVTAALWKAFAAGAVTEAEAEELSGLIEARITLPVTRAATQGPKAAKAVVHRRVGSRPRTDASLERRRRWAASGRLPPAVAARFSLAEQAVLALVAAESVRHKDCRLAIGNLAATAGVSETTVRNAIREAVRLGLVTVEERRVTSWRNDTNIVRIISAEWKAWLRLGRKRKEEKPVLGGGGCKSVMGTPTRVLTLWIPETKRPSQRPPKGSKRRPTESAIRNRSDQ